MAAGGHKMTCQGSFAHNTTTPAMMLSTSILVLRVFLRLATSRTKKTRPPSEAGQGIRRNCAPPPRRPSTLNNKPYNIDWRPTGRCEVAVKKQQIVWCYIISQYKRSSVAATPFQSSSDVTEWRSSKVGEGSCASPNMSLTAYCRLQ